MYKCVHMRYRRAAHWAFVTLFEFLSVSSCRGLKNPSSVLHSRIVTVSRFTVTSVMKTRSVVACTFGSQSFGFADFGDANNFTFEFPIRLCVKLLFSLLCCCCCFVRISPLSVVDFSGVFGSVSVLITILLLSGISFAVLIVVGLTTPADVDDDDDEEEKSVLCFTFFVFSTAAWCGAFALDEDDDDSVAESCESSTFTTIGCGTMIDFFVSMMIFGERRGFVLLDDDDGVVFLMVMPILPDSFDSTSALRLAPIGRSSLLLLSLLDEPASSSEGMRAAGTVVAGDATLAAGGSVKVLRVVLEPLVALGIAAAAAVMLSFGLECSSFFLSLLRSSSGFFRISLILKIFSFLTGGGFLSSYCDSRSESSSEVKSGRLSFFLGVAELLRWRDFSKMSMSRWSRMFSSGSHVLCRCDQPFHLTRYSILPWKWSEIAWFWVKISSLNYFFLWETQFCPSSISQHWKFFLLLCLAEREASNNFCLCLR